MKKLYKALYLINKYAKYDSYDIKENLIEERGGDSFEDYYSDYGKELDPEMKIVQTPFTGHKKIKTAPAKKTQEVLRVMNFFRKSKVDAHQLTLNDKQANAFYFILDEYEPNFTLDPASDILKYPVIIHKHPYTDNIYVKIVDNNDEPIIILTEPKSIQILADICKESPQAVKAGLYSLLHRASIGKK